MKNKALIDRFLRYAAIDTQSMEDGPVNPSTDRQRDLAGLLVQELKDLGITDVTYDEEHCYVYAKIPGNSRYPRLGFIAHMDTSPAVSGKNVAPRLIASYDDSDPILHISDFPELKKQLGKELIATDGTTLLGADDKAGIAEIMTMAAWYMEHPEIDHRPIRIAFTPDEEIGCGTDHFDLELFDADAAYTVDGGEFGCTEYETFNAAKAVIRIHGRSVHPGSAKGLMINACILANEFNNALPSEERPEKTDMYEGFYMLSDMKADVEGACLNYIIRDHDREIFENRKACVAAIAAKMNARYGAGTVEAVITDQYYNMQTILKDHMDLVERAYDSIRAAGGEPYSLPVRGGTDGAMLTFRGLPCPNLCTGGYNYHSRFEYASVEEMEKCVEMLIGLAGL